MGSRHSI